MTDEKSLERRVSELIHSGKNRSWSNKEAGEMLDEYLKESPLPPQQQMIWDLLKENLDSDFKFYQDSLNQIRNPSYEMQRVDLVGPAQRLINNYELLLTADQQLTFHAPNELFAQTNQLVYEESLNNLLSNAQKYTARGSIDVELFQEGKYAVVQVEDEGPGIPQDALEEIFMHGNVVRKRQGNVHGNGIGLSHVKREVEELGGRVTVDSKEGVGSTFVLYFPSA